MVAVKHGVALVLLLAVLGLSTALAQKTKREGLVTEAEAKKVVEVERPNSSAKVIEHQTKRIVRKGQRLAAQRSKANKKLGTGAKVADYKSHSKRRGGYGYDKDHHDSYKHHDAPPHAYPPHADYPPQSDYPSYGDYPAPVTPVEDFDMYVDIYYYGEDSNTDITANKIYGNYYAWWEAEEPSAGDPHYGYYYTYYEKDYVLIVADSVTIEGTAGAPTSYTLRGFYTDRETTFSDYDGQPAFTDEGYQYYESYGTYPDAFNPKNWKIDGTIVPGTTVCYWNCPSGGYVEGIVTSVTASPFGETTVLNAMDPIWRKHVELTCVINEGDSC